MDDKTAYRRFIETAFNRGKLDNLSEVVTDNYFLHDAPTGMPQGPAAIATTVTMFRAAFPDLRIEIHEQVAENGLVCSRTTMTGTHRGAIFGIAPTGRSVRVPGLTMVRVVNGRVTESWVKNDTAALMKQLGA